MTGDLRATATRSMPAGADVVFDIVTDLDDLAAWLPPGVEVERYGPNLLRIWTARDEVVERAITVDWDRLRVEWGSETTPTYAGRLQVLRTAPRHCAVCFDVTGPAGLPHHRLVAWVERSLTRLAVRAGAERRVADVRPLRMDELTATQRGDAQRTPPISRRTSGVTSASSRPNPMATPPITAK
ncbi:SRPBCC family protein [Saccharothrix obliqua]|uniref:SRPBCC family protein n=1 Tax=Saccharothrix obliqua TaxID=2861747 RepID=UPI001C5FCC9F|nr:SRPBCC family protein [Saccharothrix obliqua]MBW4720491.1 hypothetical protein [Saccharothrix obliqua]